jgi:hypothetical protein
VPPKQAAYHLPTERIAKHPARPGVQNHCQVDKAGRDANVYRRPTADWSRLNEPRARFGKIGSSWSLSVVRTNLRREAHLKATQMPELLAPEERLQGHNQEVTQQRMLREMTHGLEALTAEAPLVPLLEDLHWSDFSSLELISAVARRSDTARLLIVGTYRPVGMLAHDHPLRTMKQELGLRRCYEELRLKLLSEEDVADYLAKPPFQERFAAGRQPRGGHP